MDRISGLLTAGAGVRTPTHSFVSGFVLAGAGVETTRVKMEGLAPVTGIKTMPVGFFGFGGDLRVVNDLRVGASYRALILGHFDHHEAQASMDTEPELASQVQFHLRMPL